VRAGRRRPGGKPSTRTLLAISLAALLLPAFVRSELLRALSAREGADLVAASTPDDPSGPRARRDGGHAGKVTAGEVAVLFPDLEGPYRTVFSRIVEGVEAEAGGRVVSLPVGGDADPRRVAETLRERGLRVVIALGRQGLAASAAVDRGVTTIVVGGILSVPDADARELTVISLTPDPALLFERLRQFLPGARRVYAVFDPAQSGWLMKGAAEAARAQGLELVATEASDLRSAVQVYQRLLPRLDPREDALWLPQDPTTVDDAVLPLVLERSWSRGFVLFSSALGHVPRGALFSLYPNPTALGRELVATARRKRGDADAPHGIVPLRDVRAAVNVRTAGHLGAAAAARQQRYDLVFPEPSP
jgi:putative ABC transport system substrate-binding protein